MRGIRAKIIRKQAFVKWSELKPDYKVIISMKAVNRQLKKQYIRGEK